MNQKCILDDRELTQMLLRQDDYLTVTIQDGLLPFYKNGVLYLSNGGPYSLAELQHMHDCWEGWSSEPLWWLLWVSMRQKEWLTYPVKWVDFSDKMIRTCNSRLWDRWWQESPEQLLDGTVRFASSIQCLWNNGTTENVNFYELFSYQDLYGGAFLGWADALLTADPSIIYYGHGRQHILLRWLPQCAPLLNYQDILETIKFFKDGKNIGNAYEWVMDNVEPVSIQHYTLLATLSDFINTSLGSNHVEEHYPHLMVKCAHSYHKEYSVLLPVIDPKLSVWERADMILEMFRLNRNKDLENAGEVSVWF